MIHQFYPWVQTQELQTYGHIIKTENICVSKDIMGSEKIAYRTENKSASPMSYLGFPGGTVVKNPPANAGDTGDMGSIPGSGRSPGIGNGNPLQYSCLGNPMARGAWQVTVQSSRQSDLTEHIRTRFLI